MHVERAIKAHGGLEALRAVNNFHVAAEGNFMGMEYTTITHGQGADDWRHEMDMGPMGKMMLWALGPAGDVYASMDGSTTVQTGEARNGVLAHARGATAALLPHRLSSDNLKVELAESEWIGKRKYRGIDVTFADGMEPMTFLFDPVTKRVARMRFHFFDGGSLEWINAKMDVSDYREIDGVWVAHKSAMSWGNVAIAEEVTDVRFNRTPDEALFAKPETVPGPEVTVTDEPAGRVAVHTFVGPPDQVGAAIQRMMAWIGSNGGQPAGPPTTIYKKPMNFADMAKNETVIHIPVKLEKAPTDGDIRVGNTKAYKLASLTYTGNMMTIQNLYGWVHQWCQDNGYVRTGPRRMTMSGAPDPETGKATAQIGFPVKKATK